VAANLQHGSFVVVGETCTNIDDRHVTLLQVRQQRIHLISMNCGQIVHIVHDKIIAVTSKLLTLHNNQQHDVSNRPFTWGDRRHNCWSDRCTDWLRRWSPRVHTM